MEIVYGILLLLAGCGVFMTGMKLLSDGLEGSAGKSMRKLFGKISNNRFLGVGIGTSVTAIIQSSSATTVMVIGFVNAGIMSLFQATAIIMGANIGTTITAFIVSLSALPISQFMAALSLVGVMIMMFSKNQTAKQIGNMICGLGLIFVGLDLMSGALETPAIKSVFGGLFASIEFPLLLIIVGMLFTALIQSSSAATSIIITMVASTVLPVRSALFLVLGSNIGTCVTAIIASFGASVNAKRAALIHLMFNLIGTVIFAAIMWPLSKYVIMFLQFVSPGSTEFQIAIFHLIFNLTTTLLLLPFIKQLVMVATKIIKERADDKDVLKLYYIDDRILQTPPIAVAQVLKEILNMAEIARVNLERSFNAVAKVDLSDAERITKDEQRLDFINKGVGKYLVKMASLNLSRSDEKLIGSLHHVISDIERIGDYAENFLEEAEYMNEVGTAFTPVALSELNQMYEKVTELYRRSIKVFEYRDLTNLEIVDNLEVDVDNMEKLFEQNHVQRLNSEECSVEAGAHFYTLITGLERVADHLTNIAFSVKPKSNANSAPAPKKVTKDKVKKVDVNKTDSKKLKEKKLDSAKTEIKKPKNKNSTLDKKESESEEMGKK